MAEASTPAGEPGEPTLAQLRSNVERLKLRAEIQTTVLRAVLIALERVDPRARAFVDEHVEGLIQAAHVDGVSPDDSLVVATIVEARRFLAAGREPERPRFSVIDGGRADPDLKGAP